MHQQSISFIFLFLGTLCFLLFLPPYFKLIINIGNMTGTAISLLMIIYGIFQKQLHMAVRQLWKYPFGKGILSFITIFACAVAAFAATITFFLFRAAACSPDKDSSATAIVLGCAVHGDHPSLMLERRIDAAYVYLTSHPEAKAILSGGQGAGENISEAECMYRSLTEKGISKKRLYLEAASTDTKENISFSKDILETIDSSNTVVIITNEYHQYRAKIIAEKAGLTTCAVNGKTMWYLLPTYYVRELYAVMEEWILL